MGFKFLNGTGCRAIIKNERLGDRVKAQGTAWKSPPGGSSQGHLINFGIHYKGFHCCGEVIHSLESGTQPYDPEA